MGLSSALSSWFPWSKEEDRPLRANGMGFVAGGSDSSKNRRSKDEWASHPRRAEPRSTSGKKDPKYTPHGLRGRGGKHVIVTSNKVIRY